MDNEDINSDLIRRYEDMLRCGERRYFDAEDIEDIAYEYELSEQYRDALGVIEYGLELHPGNIDLLVRRAGYLLCLDRIDEAERQIDEIHSHTCSSYSNGDCIDSFGFCACYGVYRRLARFR